MMKQDQALGKVMNEHNHDNPEILQSALLTLDRVVSPPNDVQASPSLQALHDAIVETRSFTQNNFDYSALRQVFGRSGLECLAFLVA